MLKDKSTVINKMFEGRNLIIATKHRKEIVIVPSLKGALGVICTVAEDLDTGILGTFTGEVERRTTR